jgi:hypothetical protein
MLAHVQDRFAITRAGGNGGNGGDGGDGVIEGVGSRCRADAERPADRRRPASTARK